MPSSARLPAQRQEPALHSPGTPHVCPGLDVHENMLCPTPLLSLGPKAPPSLGLQASQLNSSVCVTQGQQTERPTDPTMLTGEVQSMRPKASSTLKLSDKDQSVPRNRSPSP